ncbi:cyclin-G2 isoform X1 [Erpetoichthys calabaricus]|uniref:cyclin-G2 isoform X1 n=1 Tax=Erpetoichthys calabaricus TaxID=27687 RepID=UPI0022341A11|nr:cyclin-G2 isoform X1 [Erpetoichthys calabaricus]
MFFSFPFEEQEINFPSKMKDLCGEELSNEVFKLLKQLHLHLEQEVNFLPKEAGLNLLEAAPENDKSMSAKQRDAQVEDLWSLTKFFGFNTETFVLAVNLLDRFLAKMKVQPKHLSCIGICCFNIAARVVEKECNIPSTHDIIRISQCKCTISDLTRMEKIISEKLMFQFKAITALTFLHLYHAVALSHTSERKEILNLEKLEAQLKACHCRLVFSKAKVSFISYAFYCCLRYNNDAVHASFQNNTYYFSLFVFQPSVLALSLLTLEIESLKSLDLFEIAQRVQQYSKIDDKELFYWRELVSKCLADYSSPECCKPNLKKLVWIVSRRTAQNLHSSYYSVPELPTIPEGAWDESESEDSCEDMSCEESE